MTEFTAGRFRAVVINSPGSLAVSVEALDGEGKVAQRFQMVPSDIPDLQHVLRRAEQQIEAS